MLLRSGLTRVVLGRELGVLLATQHREKSPQLRYARNTVSVSFQCSVPRVSEMPKETVHGPFLGHPVRGH